MDYRELLKKYIQHIIDEESDAYLAYPGWSGEDFFTAEEWAELKKCEAEMKQALNS